MSQYRIYVAVLMLMLTVACNKSWVDVRHDVEKGWIYADSLQADFSVQDTTKSTQISVGVDVTDEYAYSNLYILFTVKTPSGMEQQSRVQLVLTDSAGNWYASRQFNGVYSMQTTLNSQAHFVQKGLYTLRLKHYMRPDTLEGIRQVRFKIETAH